MSNFINRLSKILHNYFTHRYDTFALILLYNSREKKECLGVVACPEWRADWSRAMFDKPRTWK